MSAISNYRDIGPEDYLAKVNKDQAAKKAGNTSQNQLTESGIIGAESNYQMADSVAIDPNKQDVLSDYVQTDSVKTWKVNTGGFEICGGNYNTNGSGRALSGQAKQRGFKPGAGNYRNSTRAVIDFSDIG